MNQIPCPNCGKAIYSFANTCIHCGSAVSSCPNCKTSAAERRVACPQCGYEFRENRNILEFEQGAVAPAWMREVVKARNGVACDDVLKKKLTIAEAIVKAIVAVFAVLYFLPVLQYFYTEKITFLFAAWNYIWGGLAVIFLLASEIIRSLRILYPAARLSKRIRDQGIAYRKYVKLYSPGRDAKRWEWKDFYRQNAGIFFAENPRFFLRTLVRRIVVSIAEAVFVAVVFFVLLNQNIIVAYMMSDMNDTLEPEMAEELIETCREYYKLPFVIFCGILAGCIVLYFVAAATSDIFVCKRCKCWALNVKNDVRIADRK